MRARLARSDRPDRIFETVLAVAKSAGLVGWWRILDSTPIYDAVASMDTVTLVRSAIRGLLKAADAGLEAELRGLLARDDDYVPQVSRYVTTRIARRGRRWWMRWPVMRWRSSGRWMGATSNRR